MKSMGPSFVDLSGRSTFIQDLTYLTAKYKLEKKESLRIVAVSDLAFQHSYIGDF